MRVCLEPGCPEVQSEPRCPAHRRQREQRRGTRQDRGYDAEYDAERNRYASSMANGAVYRCWRCGRPVFPHEWDLGHCDDDRGVIHGPEHPACNRGARGACTHPSHRPDEA